MVTENFTHLLVPVASLEDAKRTCESLDDYLSSENQTITIVHVIEHVEGFIDPTSPEALEQEAEELFSYIENYFGDSIEIQRELRYGTDAIEEIIEAADELNVSAIAFSPRSTNRLEQLLFGNSSYELVTKSHHPVVAFSKSDDG